MVNRANFSISLLVILITVCTACQNKSANTSKATTSSQAIIYTDKQLESFLDSIGGLSTQTLANKSSSLPDSVFTHQTQFNKILSVKDFDALKSAALKGSIGKIIAKQIFHEEKIDSICENIRTSLNEEKELPVILYSFGRKKTSFDEYAICLGEPTHCSDAQLYFFKKNKIISKHYGYNRYGINLAHYKDIDGKTIIYYRQEFVSGSGNWWHQYFFYKYDGDKLLPILNELQNGNINNTVGNRVLWLESFIQKTNPLTIKMVYYAQLPDTTRRDDSGPMFINDSTMVEYSWDEKSKKLIGQYNNSKLNRAKVLSYNLTNNDILFINAYYKELKLSLSDKEQRALTLRYLNYVKNNIN